MSTAQQQNAMNSPSVPLILVVDGGGSKCEFALVTSEGKIDQSVTIPHCVNPNFSGLERMLEVLHHGMHELSVEKRRVTLAFFGIAGCHDRMDYAAAIGGLAAPFAERCVIEGDLRTSFFSQCEQLSGMLLLAGTGSAIAQIEGGSVRRYKSRVGGSGISLAKFIEESLGLERGRWARLSSWYRAARVDMKEPHLVARVSSELNQATLLDPALQDEITPLLHRFGAAWVTQAVTFLNSLPLPSELPRRWALAGSLWHWIPLREYVRTELESRFPLDTVLHDTERRPLHGGIAIARRILGAYPDHPSTTLSAT